MRRRATLAGVVLLPAFVCGIAAFARAVGFGFVYDDHWTVEGAPIPFGRLVRWLATGTAHSHGIADATRPVMVLSVWIDRTLFGAEGSAGYHAHSLLLYGVAGALAAWVSLELTRRHRIALVTGLVFALAPVHAEVACAINYREDVLAAIGVLAALGCLVRSRSTPRSDALGAAAFAFALFAKESAVVLVPIAGASMLIVPHVRARIFAKRRLLVALAAVGTAWALWRFAVAFDDIPRAHTALGARILGTARYCVRTGVAALVPLRACPDYARLPPASAWWLAPLAAWSALIVFFGRRRETRIVALGLAIGLLAPIATSPLALPVNEIADRYSFLAVLGTGLVFGWIASRAPIRTRTLAMVLVPFALALGVACDAAGAAWKSDRTLWTRATEQSPTSPRAWLGLSQAMRASGDLDEADRAIDRALALDPKFIGAHVTRTYNLLARGNVEGARAELAVIHGLRGDDHAGVARATRCAALEREAAIECAR